MAEKFFSFYPMRKNPILYFGSADEAKANAEKTLAKGLRRPVCDIGWLEDICFPEGGE